MSSNGDGYLLNVGVVWFFIILRSNQLLNSLRLKRKSTMPDLVLLSCSHIYLKKTCQQLKEKDLTRLAKHSLNFSLNYGVLGWFHALNILSPPSMVLHTNIFWWYIFWSLVRPIRVLKLTDCSSSRNQKSARIGYKTK